MNTPTPVAIVVRVSTAKQETARQESELREVAANNKWDVVKVIRYTVSGRACEKDRDDLAQIRELVAAGKIKKVLAHEISRVGRKNSVVHKFVEDLTDAGVSLYWHAQRMETLLPSGKMSPAASIMLAILSDMARSEVDTTRERIVSGINEARKQGKQIGREIGWRLSKEKFLERHSDAVAMIQRKPDASLRDIAARTKKSTNTISIIKKLLAT